MKVPPFLRDIWEFLYPPYELSLYGPKSDSKSEPENSTATLRNAKKLIASDVQQSHLEIAEAIYKSEIDRKKSIEDKAGTFLAGVAIASSILIALPALLTERVGGSLVLKMMVLCIFIIAVGYLIIAAVYAVKVRARAALYVINSASLQTFSLTATDFRRQWADHLLDLVRRNEPLLLLKTNQLYIAEKTFLRGVIVASLGGFLLGIFAIACPKVTGKISPPLAVETISELTKQLVKSIDSNTTLILELSTERRTVTELDAKLTESLKANIELQTKLTVKKKRKKEHLVRPVCQAP